MNKKQDKPSLAIFDLDHTLILCDSDVQWPLYLRDKDLLSDEYVKTSDAFFDDYQAGVMDIHAFLTFQLAPLARFSREELTSMHQEFLESYIRPYITDTARQMVRKHRDRGDEIILLSATNEFIITPIAAEFGIDEVIGVRLKTDATGCFTGEYTGTPSFQSGKVTRLNEWLAAKSLGLADFEATYFYSDSHNDLPLLQTVTHPVAVNPDAVLGAEARKRDWPIISFD